MSHLENGFIQRPHGEGPESWKMLPRLRAGLPGHTGHRWLQVTCEVPRGSGTRSALWLGTPECRPGWAAQQVIVAHIPQACVQHSGWPELPDGCECQLGNLQCWPRSSPCSSSSTQVSKQDPTAAHGPSPGDGTLSLNHVGECGNTEGPGYGPLTLWKTLVTHI